MAEDDYEKTFRELLMLNRKVRNDDKYIRLAVEAVRTAFSGRTETPRPLILFSSRILDARTEFIQKLMEFLNTYKDRLQTDSEKLSKIVDELIPTAIWCCDTLKEDIDISKVSFQSSLQLWGR